tara:strand:- start:191 stop:751 length:561 start_codon:yes stop_codon:yes gene_type:complete
MNKKKSTFEILNSIDVSKSVEVKGRLKYLSWADAWTMTSFKFPDVTYCVVKMGELNYHHDGKTAWVETEVTLNGKTLPEMLAVMDNYNKSIPLEKITSTHVAKSIKRCLAKNLALHGLGLSLWSKTDLDFDDNTSSPMADESKGELLTADQLSQVLSSNKKQAKLTLDLGYGSPEQIKQIKNKFQL